MDDNTKLIIAIVAPVVAALTLVLCAFLFWFVWSRRYKNQACAMRVFMLAFNSRALPAHSVFSAEGVQRAITLGYTDFANRAIQRMRHASYQFESTLLEILLAAKKGNWDKAGALTSELQRDASTGYEYHQFQLMNQTIHQRSFDQLNQQPIYRYWSKESDSRGLILLTLLPIAFLATVLILVTNILRVDLRLSLLDIILAILAIIMLLFVTANARLYLLIKRRGFAASLPLYMQQTRLRLSPVLDIGVYHAILNKDYEFAREAINRLGSQSDDKTVLLLDIMLDASLGYWNFADKTLAESTDAPYSLTHNQRSQLQAIVDRRSFSDLIGHPLYSKGIVKRFENYQNLTSIMVPILLAVILISFVALIFIGLQIQKSSV